ncbi:hypothetical protein Droror1_Dr00024398 [Drosera rotundifolia]
MRNQQTAPNSQPFCLSHFPLPFSDQNGCRFGRFHFTVSLSLSCCKHSDSLHFSLSPHHLPNPFDSILSSSPQSDLAVEFAGLFMALQPKMIACGNKLAAFSMAVRFITGLAVMAVASIIIGLRGDLLRIAIVQIIWPKLKLLGLIILVCKCMIGLIPELFPNAKYVLGIMTGSMEPYLKKLRRYAGWLPLVCADYGASEGWIAANVNPKSPPESATFTVLPDIGNNAFAFTVDLGYQRRLQTIA